VDIKAAYRRLAKIYHPDVSKRADDEWMIRLNQAYATLCDPAKRMLYDFDLDRQGRARGETPRASRINRPGAAAPRRPRRPTSPPTVDLGPRGFRRLKLKSEVTYTQRTLDSSRACKCHRCGHLWYSRQQIWAPERCPSCRRTGWGTRRIFRCRRCAHVWDTGDLVTRAVRLYPTCPQCFAADWNRPSYRRRQLRAKCSRRYGGLLGWLLGSLEASLS